MIKLTLTPHTQPITYIFEKNIVTIGSLAISGSLPDLVLSQNDVQHIHVKIKSLGREFVAFNVAEDPFTTINNLPFSKKVLQHGDLLQIGSTLLQFEGFYQENQNGDIDQHDDLDAEIHAPNDPLHLYLEEPSDIDPFDLEAAMRDLDEWDVSNASGSEIFSTSESSSEYPVTTDQEANELRNCPDAQVISGQFLKGLGNNNLPDWAIESDLMVHHGITFNRPISAALAQHNQVNDCCLVPNVIPHRNVQLQLADDELEDLMLRVEELENLYSAPARQNEFPNEESHETEALVDAASSQHEEKSIPLPLVESQPSPGTEPAASLNLQEGEDELQEIISEPRTLARRKSMKDDSSNDEENSSPRKENAFSQSSLIFSITWKELLLSFAAFSLLIAIVLGCLYVAIMGHNEEEEIKAAQAVADVAMALNFAQINHAEPQNQNWSDPEFLKHNLTAVLASEYTPLANVDSQGQFYKISYILRIYTGADLNHFLIIAQPIPSLLQWFMPKAAITVDSSFMVLRKISDLKTLNRLLVNVTLDTSNSTDITNFVQLGELLPLVELKKYHPHTGFDLPKALALIHPGAENLIYNGVRYYPLGESLMKKAVALYKSDDNGQDLLPLIDEISRFTQFPNIVLYSSEGMQMAQRGQKALATFFPHYKFLHAYLQFNSEHLPSNSHLLIDDSAEELVAGASDEDSAASKGQPEKSLSIEGPIASPVEEKEAEQDNGSLLMNSEKEIDQNHPLYYKLMVLRHAREHSLMILDEEENHVNADENFANHGKGIPYKNRHQTIINNLQEKIIRAISALQQEYATMPFGQFMSYVKAAGLESLIEENLQRHMETPESENAFQNQLLKIQQSTSLRRLNSNLKNLLQLLTLEDVPDPKMFILYQNMIRTNVLRRLDILLLSPTEPLPATDIKEENLTVISHILKAAWVTDEGELDYYTNEFKQLLGST